MTSAPIFRLMGSRIAFASNRSGSHFEIFVMNSDGSDVRQLTVHPDHVHEYVAALVAQRRMDRVSVDVSGTFQIDAIRPDGTRLSQNHGTGVNQFPAWSPDGLGWPSEEMSTSTSSM